MKQITNDPQVSVVMSVKNDARYLKDAIESILNQTYSNFEFIIIDDGSTDSTTEIIASFPDTRIIHVEHDVSIGLTSSLCEAITIAKGKYIARMDGDDISAPKRLAVQVNFMEKNPDIGFVGSWSSVINEQGDILDVFKKVIPLNQIQRAFLRSNQFVHGSVMFRKADYISVGGYRPFFTYAQDYDLWLRLLEITKPALLPDTLYSWRLSKNGISIKKRALQLKYSQIARMCAENRKHGETEIISSNKKQVKKLLRVTSKDISTNHIRWALSHIYFGAYQRALSYAWMGIKSYPLNGEAWIMLFTALFFLLMPNTFGMWLKSMRLLILKKVIKN